MAGRDEIDEFLGTEKVDPVDEYLRGFDVGASVAETVNTPPPPKPELPGNQPRLVDPGDVETRRKILHDEAIATAINTETPEHKAERNFRGWMAGSQDAVPFFPRVRGLVAGGIAGLRGQDARAAYRQEVEHAARQIEEARAAAPAAAMVGAAPVMAATPGGVAAKTASGRIGGSALLGGAYGADAVDKAALAQGRNPTTGELVGGATIGSGIGLAGGLAGEAMRPLVRNASKREDQAFMREITRTEGGEGAQAMLAKNKEALVKDFEDVVAQRKDPVIRAAVKAPEGKGLQVIQRKIKPYADENAQLYSKLDDAARDIPVSREVSGAVGLRGTVGRWNPEGENIERTVAKENLKFPKEVKRGIVAKWDDEGNRVEMIPERTVSLPKSAESAVPKRVGLMNAARLTQLLEQAKSNVSPEAAARIGAIQEHLNNHWVPRTWKGETEMPAGRFRAWLTSVQNSASSVPGSLNATASYQSVNDAMAEATRIFNDYIDSIGMPEVAAKIRANNEPISALSRIRDAVAAKAKKEQLQTMGLGSIIEGQQRQMERTAALWSAFEGKPVAAAAIMAKPYAEKGIRRSVRWINANVLEPMQNAAESGVSSAQLARFAIDRGIPEGIANAMASRAARRASGTRETPPVPADLRQSPIAQSVLGGWQEGQMKMGGRDVDLLERLKEIRAQQVKGSTP